jgi:purine nucleosidase
MPAQRILIDCDPGHDDAVAILMALAVPTMLDVVGLTTVAGNAGAEQCAQNAAALCQLAGRPDLPIRVGCVRPMILPFRDATLYHGATGLDGFPLPRPPAPLSPEHAVDFIIDQIMTSAEPLTLVCLAPLTNIALALVKQPAIAARIGHIVLMGGAQRSGGNVTPAATFNMVCDPHAAHVVLTSQCPLTLVNLDVTSQVRVASSELAALADHPGAVTRAAHAMLHYFNHRRMTVYGCSEAELGLNDPCVIAYLLAPHLFAGRQVNVAIEHQSDLTMGGTVVDYRGVTGRAPNALWLDQVDAPGVQRLVYDVLTGRGLRSMNCAAAP